MIRTHGLHLATWMSLAVTLITGGLIGIWVLPVTVPHEVVMGPLPDGDAVTIEVSRGVSLVVTTNRSAEERVGYRLTGSTILGRIDSAVTAQDAITAGCPDYPWPVSWIGRCSGQLRVIVDQGRSVVIRHDSASPVSWDPSVTVDRVELTGG